jgi:hypothetical protein
VVQKKEVIFRISGAEILDEVSDALKEFQIKSTEALNGVKAEIQRLVNEGKALRVVVKNRSGVILLNVPITGVALSTLSLSGVGLIISAIAAVVSVTSNCSVTIYRIKK